MSKIKVVCPGCKRGLLVPEQLENATCPACARTFSIWEPSAPDDPASAGPSDADAPLVDPPAASASMVDQRTTLPYGTDAEYKSEPWYYKFLSGYAIILLILSFGLAFIATIYTCRQILISELPRGEAVVSILRVVLYLFCFLIGVLFFAALVLLAVDIGRSLRAIKRNTRGGTG